MALSQALDLNIKIAYLDRHSDKHVNILEFNNAKDSGTKPMVLLYRLSTLSFVEMIASYVVPQTRSLRYPRKGWELIR